MRKFFILIFCFFGTASMLFGSGTSGRMVPGEVTLTVAGPWSGGELDQFMPVLTAFEEKENVKVEYLTYRAEDLSSALPAQFEAGETLADIIFMWKWWVIENARHAEGLTDMWNADEYLAKAGRADGRVVAVPYVVAIKPGFWYNKTLFKEHGLKEPRSWEEFTDLLRALGGIEGIKRPIVSGDGTGWPIGDLVEHFIVAFGGPELHEDLMNQRVKWTDPKVKRIFTDYLVPLIEAGAFSDPVEWTQAVELWWGGDYGLYFMGNWITGMISGDPMDLGVFALPGTKGAVTPTDYAFIPKYSENVEIAKDLLAFMLSREGQRIRAESGGKFIIRKDIPADAYPEVDQAVAEVMSQLDTTLEDLDDIIGGDWQRLYWDQLKLLWVSPKSLDDVLSKLQQGLP